MLVTFRLLVIALIGIGLVVGASFGLGVAYGKGDTKTVNSGLTQQQIQALVGGTGGTGATGGTGGAQTSTTPRAATTAGAGATAAGNTTGTITAIDAQSITVQTAQGASVKLNIAAGTTIQTLAAGKTSDLKVGDSVIAAGTRAADGSVAATSVSALPALIQGLLGGGGAGGRPGAQATP